MQKELEEVKGSLYVMVSTLNQMVNYIPYKYFGFDKVWNITTNDKKNKDWDIYYGNVKDTQIDKNIEFQHSEILKITQIEKRIKRELKSLSNNKIFWNITGGQRPFVLAIHNLIKSDELKDKIQYLCYLEGNKGEMRIMKFENGILSDDVTNSYSYQIEGLTIEIALKLMGYNPNGIENLKNILENKAKQQTLAGFYSKFYEAYKDHNNKNSNGKKLREIMPEFNSNTKNFDAIIDKFPTIQGLTKDEIEEEWKDYKTRKTFGYILEDMLLYLLLKSIKDNGLEKYIAGIYPSTKINANYMDTNETVDEFDTLILTKTGQIISFEAKSGSMSGDNAKSTNYSTYAIAGVYGLPILITPQINDCDKINKNITGAVNAAKRANLGIWYLEDIGKNLKTQLTK